MGYFGPKRLIISSTAIDTTATEQIAKANDFPRDFRLFPSSTITDATIRMNLRIYKWINPSWDSPSNAMHGEPDTAAFGFVPGRETLQE
jgi:hypothetical protein